MKADTAQPDLFFNEPLSPLHFERQAQARGYSLVAGIDEAGRGPLAGPVVAAAVILPETFDLPGLTDACRSVLRATLGGLTPVDVKAGLETMELLHHNDSMPTRLKLLPH